MSLYKIFKDYRLKDCPLCDDRGRLEVCNCKKFDVNVIAHAMRGKCKCEQCVGLEDFPRCGDDQYWYETQLTTTLDKWLERNRVRQVSEKTICVFGLFTMTRIMIELFLDVDISKSKKL